jgi:serine/threonine protein kinase
MASDPTENGARPADEGGATRIPPSAPTADTDPSLAFDLETIWQAVERGSPEPSDPLLGKKLGGVTLVRLIGEGGMGRIYEGEQETPKRAVAVKVQRPGRLDLEHTRRFVREMSLLGRISHPWVCRIYTAGIHEQGGTQFPYFVMEYIPGAEPITLHAARLALPLDQRVRLFRDVCEAVAAGHALGIHHRDLKPGNVLVAADGFPKVIDFGVAHACADDGFSASLTQSGQLVGTLQYSAPELLGGAEADARSDVWSLGMILHELVTGRLPFDVTGMPVLAAITKLGRHVPILQRTAHGRTSRAIAEVVDACLENNPASRPNDAADVARRLSNLLATTHAAPLTWSHTAIEERFEGAGKPRLRKMSIAAGATALLGSLAILIPSLSPSSFAPRGEPGGEQDPKAATTVVASPVTSPDFQFGFPTIDTEGAEQYLVESTGLSKWHEPFGSNKSYWAPRKNDAEGRIIYRFDFPRTSRRVHLLAHLAAWDDSVQKGVLGRGAGTIEASTDGETWIPLANGLEPPAWGKSQDVNGFLPDECIGSTTLWIRVRLLTTGAWSNGSYSVAQFGGAEVNNTTNIFQIDVECEADEPPTTATAGGP